GRLLPPTVNPIDKRGAQSGDRQGTPEITSEKRLVHPSDFGLTSHDAPSRKTGSSGTRSGTHRRNADRHNAQDSQANRSQRRQAMKYTVEIDRGEPGQIA